MNPIIIMGMDNTGKTTLQERLNKGIKDYFKNLESVASQDKAGLLKEIKGMDIASIKSPGPLGRKEMHTWCYTQMIRFDNPHNRIEIYDRFGAIDEQIYAPIVRNNHQLDHVKHLMNMMADLPLAARPFFIYSRPHKDKILGFEDGREQMEGVMENGEQLLKAYDELYFRMASSGLYHTVLYSYEAGHDISELVGQYIKFVIMQKSLTANIDIPVLSSWLESPLIIPEDIEKGNLEDLQLMQQDIRFLLNCHTNLWRACDLQGVEIDNKHLRESLLKQKLRLAKEAMRIDGMILEKL